METEKENTESATPPAETNGKGGRRRPPSSNKQQTEASTSAPPPDAQKKGKRGRPKGSKTKKRKLMKGSAVQFMGVGQQLPAINTLPVDYLVLCVKRLREIAKQIDECENNDDK